MGEGKVVHHKTQDVYYILEEKGKSAKHRFPTLFHTRAPISTDYTYAVLSAKRARSCELVWSHMNATYK